MNECAPSNGIVRSRDALKVDDWCTRTIKMNHEFRIYLIFFVEKFNKFFAVFLSSCSRRGGEEKCDNMHVDRMNRAAPTHVHTTNVNQFIFVRVGFKERGGRKTIHCELKETAENQRDREKIIIIIHWVVDVNNVDVFQSCDCFDWTIRGNQLITM